MVIIHMLKDSGHMLLIMLLLVIQKDMPQAHLPHIHTLQDLKHAQVHLIHMYGMELTINMLAIIKEVSASIHKMAFQVSG